MDGKHSRGFRATLKKALMPGKLNAWRKVKESLEGVGYFIPNTSGKYKIDQSRSIKCLKKWELEFLMKILNNPYEW